MDDPEVKKALHLRDKILRCMQDHEEEMFYAFSIVLMKSVQRSYNSFIEGLELSEDEKCIILQGMLDRRMEAIWDDLDLIIEFGEKILLEFERKVNKRSWGSA